MTTTTTTTTTTRASTTPGSLFPVLHRHRCCSTSASPLSNNSGPTPCAARVRHRRPYMFQVGIDSFQCVCDKKICTKKSFTANYKETYATSADEESPGENVRLGYFQLPPWLLPYREYYSTVQQRLYTMEENVSILSLSLSAPFVRNFGMK